MVQYHKRGRGRPRDDSSGRQTATNEQIVRSAVLLRGKKGSADCPIDILEAQRILSKSEAEAIRTYGVLWSRAYGLPNRFSGNVWSRLSGSGASSGSDSDETEDSVFKKRRFVELFNSADDILKVYAPDARSCIRHLCEGKMPYYLKDIISVASKNYRLILRLDDIDEEIKHLKADIIRKKADKHVSSNEINAVYQVVESTIQEKKRLTRIVEALSDSKEPDINVYIREQMRLAVKGLVRHFRITD